MLDILIGLQWGDEGKGKIVDLIAPKYHAIARFQGGPNAGHTLKIGDQQIILHLIPSGILRPDTLNIIGNGVVFDPVVFVQEIKNLQNWTKDLKERIFISTRAHLILPTHKLIDKAQEQLKGKNKIGSTLRGIGPTYTDKVARKGLRVGEILDKNFDQKLSQLLAEHIKYLESLEFYDINLEQTLDQWTEAIEQVRQFNIVNSEYLVNTLLERGASILAEGAQGTLLDVDFGTYPYVTSSNTIAAAACTGLGVSPRAVASIIGVFKAYTTRVGSGPFPTELHDEIGDKIRQKGFEYGATTGRPRRVGWLDMVALKYAVMINDVDQLIMTKVDVLSGLDKIKIATNYKNLDHFPISFENITVQYQEFDSWDENLNQPLPQELSRYIQFIEKQLNRKLTAISIGPRRRDILWFEQKSIVV